MCLEVSCIHFEESAIHKIEVGNNETLFCAKDIAIFLGFTEATESAISLFCKRSSKHVVDWKGKEASITFIPLSDVNELVIKSEALRAQAFGDWINAEFAQIPNSRIENSALNAFNFGAIPVRVVFGADGEPWWIAADVCAVLDIANPRDAMSRLDPDEKSTVGSTDGRLESTLTPGSGPQSLNIINESGLYSLILGSRKPEAKAFRKWVTSEVLPQIRKTGKYAVAQAPALPNFSNPSAAARAWAEEYDAKQAALQQAAALSMRVEEMRPAQELVDVITNTEGAKEINDCAKELKIDPLKLLRKWMLENEWIFEKTIKGRKHTFAYQDKASRGWLVHDRKIIATGEGIDYVMVTEKGFVELGKRYLKDNPFDHEEFRAKTTPKKRKTKKEL